jgi:hypothetical protein
MLFTAHIQDEELTQYVGETLDRARASNIRSHIIECTRCEDRLVSEVVTRLAALGKGQQPSNRRERRVPASSLAWLQTLCPLSLDRIPVEVLDTSKTGFGLRTTLFLEPGTIVDLRIGTTPAMIATVRYCRNLEDHTYQAGVQLQASTRPNA